MEKKGEMVQQTSQETDIKRQVQIVSRPLTATLIIIMGLVVLALCIGISISFGAIEIKLSTVWEALVEHKSDVTSHQIIMELRLPRAIAAVLVGGFLAVSGAIMQGMTRNPLAEPSIMGVTDGAAFTIAIAFAFYPGISYTGLLLWSFAGAGVGAILVFVIGIFSKGGLTPVKLALAGAAVGALLRSISSVIALHYKVAQDISFWYAGGLAGSSWTGVKFILPIALIGLVIALLLGRSVTVMSLGEEVAKGLGQRTALIKILGIVVVIILTGAAVSIAGPIGFIGLVIPHITRFLVGVDYRLIIPCSAVLGGLLLVLADIGARAINPPFETPVGAITAVIGVPFFLFLARRERKGL